VTTWPLPTCLMRPNDINFSRTLVVTPAGLPVRTNAPISGIEILSVSVIQTCLERRPVASQHDFELADSGDVCCLNIGFTDGQRLVGLPMRRSSRARRRSMR
jgi:hypothetical protein